MKQSLIKKLCCVLFIAAASMSAQATSSIHETFHYTICPGDTITKLTTRDIVVYSDTIVYDTIITAGVPESDTLINVYDVNVYPRFDKTEYKELEVGKTISWCDMVIDRAGTYVRRYQSIHGCDSIHRLVVTEHVYTIVENHIVDTLCEGSAMSFGHQTLTQPGVYRDTIHFSRYDSVVVLTLNVFKPDTVVQNIRIPEGSSWTWNGQQYSTPGVYDSLLTNRYGCDSLSQLILSTYRVDTIDTVVSICPNTTFTWHGMTQGTTGDYEFPGTRDNGDKVYYRMHLTVKELVQIDTTATICDEESFTFQGKTYVNAGEYNDYYTCDTLYRITVVKHPTQLHEQTGVLDKTHPYYWQYMQDGETKVDTITKPGRYEHTSHNAETGCNDIWRLILTRDETTYHYIETVTICENEPYEWRGRTNLNRLGIGQTTHYYDRYKTVADQDSIYELILTVKPVLRTSRTIPFCGSVVWNGQTITESQTIIDTVQSVQYGCDSIVTAIFVKGYAFHHHDTATILPGETMVWRGQTITTDGLYEDKYVGASGCDSIYTIGVGLKAEVPATKTRTWKANICEGEYYEWKGEKYYNSGTFIDTLYVSGTDVIDSLHVLHLTVNPIYESTERVTFLSFPQTYREQYIPGPGEYIFTYQSSLGCDSIIKSYIDQEVYREEQTVTICPGDVYIWDYDGQTYTVSGKYTKVEQNVLGQDSVIHVLNLTVRYIPETLLEETICSGETYVFGDSSITTSGVYRHTFHKTGGCDSTVVLSLNVVSPDTTYLAIQREQGTSYVWDGETITKPGIYHHYSTNRFGCDSVSILNYTYNQVDTISDTVTVCPNDLPYIWNGIEANQTNHYSRTEQLPNGNYIYYSLYLTVKNVIQVDTTLTMCEGDSKTFNGVTYDQAGLYRSYLNCDTLMNVRVVVNQPVLLETHGTITDDHGYTWSFVDHGVAKTEVFTAAGTYEYEDPNPTTGCNDIYRLILTKDETSYYFEESLTVCEGDDFQWYGKSYPTNITGTTTYTETYETRAGNDSIYTLHLTVIPVERTVRTIVFCGETTWNGKTYTEDAVVYDTVSLSTGCYRIERINLDKETSFYHSESKELPQGTVLHWHGQNITTNGTYYDYNTTVHGCDSIYEITVTIIPASPETNQYAEELSSCEGDTILWRGKEIWRSGTYVDTVYKSGTEQIDSIFSLKFTAWPAPKDTIYQHLYTCSDGSSIRYNGKDYYENDTIITTFHTIHGCDSIVKVYLHFNTALYLEESDTIADTQLPYTWSYKLSDPYRQDTVLTAAGTYFHIVESEGGCTNREQITLVVYPTYLYELDTTICETDLPFEWRGKSLQHAIGETKQYEDRYSTINNTDSIYRLNLTIDEAPKRTIRLSICENKDTLINNKSYFDPIKYPVGNVYRDTAYVNNEGSACDSIIYYEITKIPQREIIETRIKHVDETFEWRGQTISDHVTKTYTQESDIDPETGCEIIYQLRVIAETALSDAICELDTPYVWREQNLYTTGIYTDTLFDAEGAITDFYSLNLRVDTVPRITEYYYVCVGYPEQIYGKTYGDDLTKTDYVDQFVLYGSVQGNECPSEITVVVTVSTEKKHDQTVVLLDGESLDWNNYHITQGGTYRDTTQVAEGCDSISTLHVIAEHRKEVTICTNDTAADVHPDKRYPYVWVHPRGGEDTLYTAGIYTDTILDDKGFISEYYTLHLHITQPYDTTIYVHGCQNEGAMWRDYLYWNDTTFVERVEVDPYTPDAPCDSVYHVNIIIDSVYQTIIDTTICETELPFIIGRQNPRLLWEEHTDPVTINDKTVRGCDSTITLTLRITPTLSKNDSTFICEDEISEHPVYLGDTINPWFADEYRGQWEGKWHGVAYTEDTIVWDCSHTYFHHIIVRPRQKTIPEVTYSICEGDSVQLFWPHDTTWIKTPGVYYDTVPTTSSWVDTKHNTTIHNDRAYACDSITKWTVVYADTVHEHLYAHIREGETYLWNDSLLSTTGVYDSIGYATSMDSAKNFCKAVYSLHLTVDPVYRYKDTISICHPAELEYTYTFADDKEEHFAFAFQTPNKDTAIIHLSDSTKHLSYEFYDHYYDLVVYYYQQYFTQIVDTVCYGDSIQFDQHYYEAENNKTIERYLKDPGVYYDTLRALNGCDSIIELRLELRERVIAAENSVTVTDRELPYEWVNTWREGGQDTTHTDSLYVTGDYTYTMPNLFGCDSTVVLHFTVHDTHVFRDTIDICAPKETTHTHFWKTGYEQTFTVPTSDDTISYADTLTTFYPMDSIYVLFVNYYEQTITYLDQNLCYGDSMIFGLTRSHQPRYLSKSGVYRDTLVRDVNGCDSIIELRLNVFPLYKNAETMHFASDAMPYIWYHVQNGDTIGQDTIRAAGEYVYTFTNSYGCDSIDSLSVRVHQVYLFRDTVTICQNETPYAWEGIEDIYETGEYIKHHQTHDGYDSTLVRYVQVLPQVFDTITATICEGDSMRFGLTKSGLPRFLTQTGMYNDTLTTWYGCDSIITLSLNFYPQYNKYQQVDIADVEAPYEWLHIQGGDTIARDTLHAAGEYTYTFKTIPFGCDSIDHLNLRIHTTYQFHDTVTICYDETPYTWYGEDGITVFKNDIYETGTYVKNLQTHDGYDSTLVRYVRVIDVINDTVRHTMCEGSDYLFNGKRYYEGGTYVDTLRSSMGCDSIVTLLLTVSKPIYVRIPVDIYEGESYSFYGTNYTTSGTYRHYGTTAEGCDSITELFLNVHPQIDTTVILCSSELPYIWVNKWTGEAKPLYNAGIYRNDTSYVNGERTFYTIQLIVNEAKQDTVRASICSGHSYQFKGEALTETGIYRDTVKATNGCDSVITLVLTVNEAYFNTRTEHIIEGNSVEFFGNTYSTTGTYTHYGTTPTGCDSTSILQLIVHPMFDTIVTVCSTELPYLWVNKWDGSITPLYSEGIYRNDTSYVNGEKMYYGLKLVVNEPQFDTTRVAICEGGSYLFNGVSLTQAGVYRDTLRAENGCDSIHTLILTVNEAYFNTRTEHILEGDSVEFFGNTYFTSGLYTHYGTTPTGCDSTSTLELVVHPLVDTIVTVCKNDLPYLWVNKWNGSIRALYEAGIYRNDTTYINGERMFYGLRLIVNEPTDTTIYREICEDDIYNFNGRLLTIGGEYRDTIKNVNGCDSVVILHLNVLDKFYHTVDRTIYEGDSVMFQGQEYRTSGIYPVRFTSSFGCDSIVELHLTVIRLFDDSISVCANDLPYQWTLPSDPTKTMTIYESGIYRDTVVNSEGQKTAIGLKVTVLPIKFAPEPIVATICEGDFYKFGDNKLTEQGTYYDTLTAVNGCDSIVSLSLQVMPVQHQIDTRTIYEGDTVFFYGDTCTVSGIYTHTERTSYGTDSSTFCYDSYQLILTVLKEFHVDTTAYVCANDLPFVWHGYEYSETGDYSLPTALTDSSRVVTTLHLTVRNTEYAEQNVTLCYGNTFIINGDTIRESGDYFDTIPSLNGCDSITRYIISVQPVFERWDTVYISDQDRYEFCPDPTTSIPRTLNKTGDYECVGKTAHGCDDIHHLHLEVHPSYHFVEYLDLCAPDTIEWHGQKIYAEGKSQVNPYLTRYGDNVEKHYFDRYLTTYGFDSIYELVVTNHPSFYTYEQHLIKELNEEGTYIHGIHITKLDTIYRDTLKTTYGCDSIFQIAVNTKRTITVERTKSICDDGNGYDFYGQIITKAGKYSAVVSGGAESTFDTIVNLTLIVNPVSITKTRIVITDEDVPYIYGGKYYTDLDIKLPQWDQTAQKWVPDVATTVIEDKYLNQYGCDSTNLIEFVVTTHYSEWNQVPLCTGSRLIIDNDTITKAGQYTFVRRSTVTNRLDSLYRIEVYEAPNYEMPVVKRSICRGDTVMFAGKTFDRNGTHPVKLKSVDGCDSIVWLELTVYPAFRMDTTVRLMQEELPFEWEHRKYYNGGDYERSWQIGECDSTRVLHLIVITPDTTRATVCVSDMPFVWAFNNQLYTESGIYLDTLRDNKDKVYAIGLLELSVVNPTTSTISVSPINSELIKEDAKSFEINFTANQGANLIYDLWFDNAALKAGFKDQNDLPVTKNGIATVPMPTSSEVSKCNMENQCGVRPGYYKVWIKIHNACNESTFGPLDFYLKYPSWIIQQKWDDIVAPLSAECNCGYEFESTEWSYNGGAWISSTYLHIQNGTFQDGDQVIMRAKRRGVNEQPVLSYPLTLHTYGGDDYQRPCQDCDGAEAHVHPRIAPRNAPVVTIEAKVEGTYDIYSSTGMFIEHGAFINGNTSVTLPTISGLYFIRTTIGEQTTTHKVLLY